MDLVCFDVVLIDGSGSCRLRLFCVCCFVLWLCV